VKRTIVIAVLVCLAGLLFAQRYGGGSRYGNRTPDSINDRKGLPEWPVDPQFKKDLFTFVRIQWRSWRYSDTWLTDFPDGELNFSFRLQQMTSLKVDPHPIHMKLTDEKLFDYPFIYMLEVGSLDLTEEEVVALRRYLLNGGFLMVDDFWGNAAWANFQEQMERVFPDRKIEDLELDHPIFHCVYDLKEKPQIPGIDTWNLYRDPAHTYESVDSREGANYRAIFDDKRRMMVMICHNTDLGDGWEREGDEEGYFREFSEKKAYPMGINIIFYAMTH
jgi:hypothetical protein